VTERGAGAPAIVTITDANGAVVDLVTNEAGNFFLRAQDATLTMPIRARLAFDGGERAMATPQGTGACGSCHTQSGANGAPGRILAP
jgi:cytochrome c553